MPDSLTELTAVRSELGAIDQDRQRHMVDLSRVRAELAVADRQGAPRTERARIEKKIRDLEAARADVSDRQATLLGRLDRLRRDLRGTREEDSVESLDGQVPVLMLPVRIETRFMPGGDELKVRIYPEQIHVDDHEPGLTEGELAVATSYWDARWAATTDEAHAAAWREVLRVVRPTRARYLVAITEPLNLDELGTGTPDLPEVALRAGPFTRQPTARLLPEQWVVIGYRAGVEVVRTWGGPVTEGLPVGLAPDLDDDGTETGIPDDQDTLALDESIEWLVDYDKALAAGMAVTITDGDVDGGLAAGFDELVVVGVDWGADPKAASTSIDEQLRRHAFTDGLAVLGTGVPTNNTDESRSAPGTDPELDGVAFDPAAVSAAPAAVSRIGAALGVDAAGGLDRVPTSGSFDDAAAGDMNNVLWAATLGAFLDQMMAPVVSSAVADRVHDHFRHHVRGQGPYAALRVGRQPYGVLPVTAGEVNTGDSFLDGLGAQLRGLRVFWDQAADEVPRLGDTATPDTDAVELLRRTPRSGTFRFRRAFAGSASSSIFGFDVAAIFQEMVSAMTLSLAGIPGRPRIAGITVDPQQRAVPVPLVAYTDLSETDRLDPNYISEVLAATMTSGGFTTLLSQPGKANTLLEALLRQAAGAEYVIGSTLLVIAHEVETSVLSIAPVHARMIDPEIIGIASRVAINDGDDTTSLLASAASPADLAETVLRPVSGNRSLVNHLAVTPNAELIRRIPTARFARFRQSLDRLSRIPTAELDRLSASTLDCVSHRLDAWETSVATRHLDSLRGERGSGTYIGGFGYVEDLHPSRDPVSKGFLHGPSISHATTAAILRSGHISRGENATGTFAVDLSSKRVSLAMDVIDGVRRGQPIGALLGYRFERAVRDKDPRLMRHVLPIRKRSPLAQVSTGPDPTNEALESIAARDVVDGVALLDAWRDDRAAYWASVPVPTSDQGALNEIVTAIDDVMDAVSDLLVAESVHQAVMGNSERSAAALDALDHQQPLPDLAVIRTPRTATGLSHRLLVLFGADTPATGWPTTSDPRRAADPRVDAWCGAVLGNPSRFRIAAEARDSEGDVVQSVSVRLSDLGLSAASVVAACGAPGTDVTDLEQRLALHLADQVSDANKERAAELVLLDEPPAGAAADALGLRDLVELAGQVAELLASGRPADAATLLPDTERPASGIDVSDLQDRVDEATASLTSAVEALEGLDGSTPIDDVLSALFAGAAAGIPGAVPGTGPEQAIATTTADTDDEETPIRVQAQGAATRGRSLLTALGDADTRFTARQAEAAAESRSVTDADTAQHLIGQLRVVFGEAIPVVPRFTLPGPTSATAEDFRASLAASTADPALLGPDLGPSAWLTMHAPVRPAVARLTGILEAGEMLGGRLGLADVHVAQLPHRPGTPWIGRPFTETPPPTTGFVIHAPTRPDVTGALAGLVIDQWTEAVPSTSETTGLSFHFDAPGARAPQTMLIATPTDRTAASWTVEALAGSVRRAVALARIRPLDIDDVDAVGRFLPAAYLPFNIESKVPGLNLSILIAAAVGIHNVQFEAANP